MRIKASKQGKLLSLKVKLGFKESLDDERCEYMTSVYLPGFFKLDQIGKHRLIFKGNSGVSLAERLSRQISEYDFYLIIEQIVVAAERLAGHDLPFQYLLLDADHIYINENTKEIQFLYVPVIESKSTDVLDFITSLVYLVKPAGSNTDYLTKFVYFIKSMTSFSPAAIENYIARKDSSIVQMLGIKQKYGKGNTVRSANQTELTESEEKTELMEEEATMILEDDAEEPTMFLDDATDYLPEDGETELIRYPTLERISQGDVIQIDRAVFRIGKDANSVDYPIRNNNAISGNHIDVISRGTHYFVIDLNSKNKTYINGRSIPPQCEKEIFEGDVVRLANEDFVFHTYN